MQAFALPYITISECETTTTAHARRLKKRSAANLASRKPREELRLDVQLQLIAGQVQEQSQLLLHITLHLLATPSQSGRYKPLAQCENLVRPDRGIVPQSSERKFRVGSRNNNVVLAPTRGIGRNQDEDSILAGLIVKIG